MEHLTELQDTINDMAQKGRGILAAAESAPTIANRFKAISTESTEENRRAWRSLLVTTAGLAGQSEKRRACTTGTARTRTP